MCGDCGVVLGARVVFAKVNKFGGLSWLPADPTIPPCQHQPQKAQIHSEFVGYAPRRGEFSGAIPEIIASKLDEIDLRMDHTTSLAFF